MTVSIRLSEYMKLNNILQKDIAEVFGVTPQAVSGIFKGKSDLTTSQIVLLANKYKDLNLRWLLTGVGSMTEGLKEYKENDSLFISEETRVKLVVPDAKDKLIESKDETILVQTNYIEFLKELLGGDVHEGKGPIKNTKSTKNRVTGFRGLKSHDFEMILNRISDNMYRTH